MSTFLRLCSVAPTRRSFWPGPATPRRRNRNRQFLTQVLRGQRSRLVHQAVQRAGKHDASALFARAEPEIDDVVGHFDHVGVVLDDEHGVALVAQLPEDVDQALVVAGMETD